MFGTIWLLGQGSFRCNISHIAGSWKDASNAISIGHVKAVVS
jgi:hypothetical protein